MGSYIYLRLGDHELCWGANWSFIDYSFLFRPEDIKRFPYEYAKLDGTPIVHEKDALVRPLHEVLPRLELLGYSLSSCRHKYDSLMEEQESGESGSNPCFDEALRLVKDGQPVPMQLDNPFEFLDPLIYLRMLAEVPENLALNLAWLYSDVVDGGYVSLEDIIYPVSEDQRFMVVTEGSSDSLILHTSLPLVAPGVDDLFSFIDMEERYPFTGAGNVVKFVEGLAKVGVSRKILVILDNDTEGRFAYQRIAQLNLPATFRVMLLPDLEDLRASTTFGPSGESLEDVNGRAVAIECFLDLESLKTPARFRWTSYNRNLECYQGELEDKDRHVRRFVKKHRAPDYNMAKLAYLWQAIINVCSSERTDGTCRPTTR
ncbi:MAG: HEPN/Toprim-associated domain-containing protein [Deltaproteobacteria bacterium]